MVIDRIPIYSQPIPQDISDLLEQAGYGKAGLHCIGDVIELIRTNNEGKRNKKLFDDITERIHKIIEEDIKEIVDSMPFFIFYTGEQGKEHFKRVCHDAGIPDAMTDSMITEIKQ